MSMSTDPRAHDESNRAGTAPARARRAYLDWLRGIAVVIMIQGHTLDSWTRVADRSRAEYSWVTMVGGIGAPIFLLLAGMAMALGSGPRPVGMACARNPIPIIVPCHRVLGSGGKEGGFSGGKGLPTKRQLLAIEGVVLL